MVFSQYMFPVGTIIPYAGDLSKIPYGWHICDGTNGTPDLSGRFLEGTKTTPKTFKDAGLPNITGNFAAYDNGAWMGNGTYLNNNGAFRANDRLWASIDMIYGNASGQKTYSELLEWCKTMASQITGYSELEIEQWTDFNASWSNSIYGASDTVQPKSYTVYYIMRVK